MIRNILVVALTGAMLLISFQNCTKATYGSKEDALKNSVGGTGNGYDGKLYAVLSLTPCPDASFIEAAILVKESVNEAYLVRESCQPVAARALAPQTYAIVSATEINYGGRSYSEVPQNSPTVPAPQKFSLFCERQVQMPEENFIGRAQIQISADPPLAYISLVEQSGIWTRQSQTINITHNYVSPEYSDYTYANPSTGEQFTLKVSMGMGQGSYVMTNVRDTNGFSGRGPTEIWRGQQPYACRSLPW